MKKKKHVSAVMAACLALGTWIGGASPVQADGVPSDDGKTIYYTVHKETGESDTVDSNTNDMVAKADTIVIQPEKQKSVKIATNETKHSDTAVPERKIKLLGQRNDTTISVSNVLPSQRINIDNYQFGTVPVKVIKEEGTLLLSDSPEYVSSDGVLAAGTLRGKSRVYFYHVNEADQDKQVAIVLENNGNTDSRITVKRKLVTEPSDAYFKVGRELSFNELVLWQASQEADAERALAAADKKYKKKQLAEKLKAIDANMPPQLGKGLRIAKEENWLLPSHSRKLLFEELSNIPIKKDQLISGIVDFTSSAPIQAKVLMLNKGSGPLGYSYIAPVQPMDDVELRGTFHGVMRYMQSETPYNSSLGASAITIGNDREDAFIKGVDELTNNKAMTDKGNYGVSYDVTIPTAGDKRFAVYFNPLGGAYAGSVQIVSGTHNKIYQVPGTYDEYIGHGTIYDTMYLDTFTPGEPIVLRFIPAGASNLPVRFLFIPLD